jgi:hypothetical protein
MRNFSNYFKAHKLDNGLVVYVYRNDRSYGNDTGLYELKICANEHDPSALHYPEISGRFDAVAGYLTYGEVEELLEKCKALAPR